MTMATILSNVTAFVTEAISNTAFTLGRSFYQRNLANDRPDNANTPGYTVHKHHRISKLPDFFINVEILRVDINLTLILPLELEEFRIAFIKTLKTSVIPNQAAFIDKQDAMRFRCASF